MAPIKAAYTRLQKVQENFNIRIIFIADIIRGVRNGLLWLLAQRCPLNAPMKTMFRLNLIFSAFICKLCTIYQVETLEWAFHVSWQINGGCQRIT